uniref:Uncharacterized protein n=1 Tax=Arundo donax TaxID=35708 RepID=A0A0A8Z2I8_ARUDO
MQAFTLTNDADKNFSQRVSGLCLQMLMLMFLSS